MRIHELNHCKAAAPDRYAASCSPRNNVCHSKATCGRKTDEPVVGAPVAHAKKVWIGGGIGRAVRDLDRGPKGRTFERSSGGGASRGSRIAVEPNLCFPVAIF